MKVALIFCFTLRGCRAWSSLGRGSGRAERTVCCMLGQGLRGWAKAAPHSNNDDRRYGNTSLRMALPPIPMILARIAD